MTVKEFLQKGRQLNFELNELKAARAVAFGKACSVSIQSYEEKIHTDSGNSSEAKFTTLADYSIEIDKRIKELSDYRGKMLRLINTLDDSTCRAVLIARYINCQSWNNIADVMHYTVRNVFILHKTALAALKI